MRKSSLKNIQRYCLLMVGGLALCLGCYRTLAIALFGSGAEAYKFANHATAILCMWCISGWCFSYYHIHYTEIYKESELKVMRLITLFASILCWLRVVTAAIYFTQRITADSSMITYAYIAGDLVLWAIMGVFFFAYWLRSRKHDATRDVHHHHHHEHHHHDYSEKSVQA